MAREGAEGGRRRLGVGGGEEGEGQSFIVVIV